jgi:choline dehydrogenase-like flavoprotein
MLGLPPDDEGDAAHLCIVGAGAAGLALAASFIGAGRKILLLEAGGERQTRASQAVYAGELTDPAVHPYLHHYRVRALGGASRIWGGRCVPFDPIDFAERDWVPGPGWPISLQSLLPYYAAAQAAAEAGPFDYDPRTALPGRPAELAPGLDGAKIETRLERFSKPTNFWTRYGRVLTAARDVWVCPQTPALAIRLSDDGESVRHLEIVDATSGARRALRAHAYVLALGGLETVRLMLASNDVRPAGVGNDHDQLGRYYMSHLAASSGHVTFSGSPSKIAFDYERDAEGVYVRRRLWVTADAQRELRLLNIVFRTHLPDPADPAHGDGVLSAMYLVKDLILYEYSRKLREHPVDLGQRLRHVGNVVRQPWRLARFGRTWVADRLLAERKLPSVVLDSPGNRYALEFHAEQSPNVDSRLTLSAERDAFGMPRLKADWRLSPIDLDSLKTAYDLLARELRRTGTGVLDYDSEAVVEAAIKAGAYGGHHLGAARMSRRPNDGVVDENLKVHGVNNLYLASGAVFPTSSQANPTLTILALALRLADHLKSGAVRIG